MTKHTAEKDALQSIWREAAEKRIEQGIDWPGVVRNLFKSQDDLRSRIACVAEATYWDRPYDERIAAIRGLCDLATDGMTPAAPELPLTDRAAHASADLIVADADLRGVTPPGGRFVFECFVCRAKFETDVMQEVIAFGKRHHEDCGQEGGATPPGESAFEKALAETRSEYRDALDRLDD